MRDREVRELHLAFEEAARRVDFYSPSADDIAGIFELTENNEGFLALDLILGAATPDIPGYLRERAYQVAGLFVPEASEDEVRASVDAWIQWNPGSGEAPPYPN